MKNFGEAERKILNLMSEGTEFIFHDKYYKVILSGKPTCQKVALSPMAFLRSDRVLRDCRGSCGASQ